MGAQLTRGARQLFGSLSRNSVRTCLETKDDSLAISDLKTLLRAMGGTYLNSLYDTFNTHY